MVAFLKRISFFIALAGMFITTSCFAQSATVSPYSRYGIGDLQDQNGVQSFSMGNTGTAWHNDTLSPYFINLKNPASYFYNRITTFEAGLINNDVSLSTEGTNYFSKNTYFAYFAIAFPIGKHFGGSFGLRPMSSVGYNINTNGTIDSSGTSLGTTTNQYVGSGGINQLHFGLAYSPVRWLSVGGNFSYMFGYLNYTQNIVYPDNISAYNSQVSENINVHGFTGDFGAMVTLFKAHDSAVQVILGGTYSYGGSLFANYNLLSLSYLLGSPQTNIDTIQDSSANGKIKLPMTFGGGITIIKRDKDNNNQWTFSADYNVQRWSQYALLGETQSLNNTTQWSGGIQYIPGKNTTFFKRIHYRAGFSWTQTYLNLGQPLIDKCISLGVGIPIGPPFAPPMNTQLGVLNIGIQLGVLGTTSNDLLQEEYAKFLVAFTFNSKWFQKHLYQ
jgi:hypothetical protein